MNSGARKAAQENAAKAKEAEILAEKRATEAVKEVEELKRLLANLQQDGK